eukprot:scaffold1418_cov352-Prasinococcus_capsulatus_cf.AAC.9
MAASPRGRDPPNPCRERHVGSSSASGGSGWPDLSGVLCRQAVCAPCIPGRAVVRAGVESAPRLPRGPAQGRGGRLGVTWPAAGRHRPP